MVILEKDLFYVFWVAESEFSRSHLNFPRQPPCNFGKMPSNKFLKENYFSYCFSEKVFRNEESRQYAKNKIHDIMM